MFPGAGFLAIAAEALCQVHYTHHFDCPTLTFRQVKLVELLTLSNNKAEVELFTQLRPARLSSIATSNTWWFFHVSSQVEGTSSVHANGFIGFDSMTQSMTRNISISDTVMEQQAVRSWYDKLASEGLSFGPSFQSLTEIYNHRAKKLYHCTSKTRLLQGGSREENGESGYVLHPITIDALLQTAIIASTTGSIQDLRAKVPVEIGYAQIRAPNPANVTASSTIRAVSENVGFGTAKISVELDDTDGLPLVQLRDVRLVAYQQGTIQHGACLERNPVLRVLWKPAVSRLTPESFTDYTSQFAASSSDRFMDINNARLAGGLDLITHENPRLRILELGYQNSNITASFLSTLDASTSLKRFQSYVQASITEEGDLAGRELSSIIQHSEEENKSNKLGNNVMFDVIVFTQVGHRKPPRAKTSLISAKGSSGFSSLEDQIRLAQRYMAPSGRLLFVLADGTVSPLNGQRYRTISTNPRDSKATITMAWHYEAGPLKTVPAESNIILVGYQNSFKAFQSRLAGDMWSLANTILILGRAHQRAQLQRTFTSKAIAAFRPKSYTNILQ